MPNGFNFGKWDGEILVLYGMYFNTIAYFSDADAAHAFARNRDRARGSGGFLITTIPKEELAKMSPREISEKSAVLSLKHAREVFKRNVIVLIVTYTEAILSEFLHAVFCAHPKRMYEFVGGDRKGSISLKAILRAASLPDLVSDIAHTAVSAAVSRFGKVSKLQRVLAQCGVTVADALCEKLRELFSLRNRIVHEASQEEISDEAMIDALGLCYELLHGLAADGAKQSVPIEEAGVDEFSLEIGAGARLLGAKYDSSTIWPDGFDAEAAGACLVEERGRDCGGA